MQHTGNSIHSKRYTKFLHKYSMVKRNNKKDTSCHKVISRTSDTKAAFIKRVPWMASSFFTSSVRLQCFYTAEVQGGIYKIQWLSWKKQIGYDDNALRIQAANIYTEITWQLWNSYYLVQFIYGGGDRNIHFANEVRTQQRKLKVLLTDECSLLKQLNQLNWLGLEFSLASYILLCILSRAGLKNIAVYSAVL